MLGEKGNTLLVDVDPSEEMLTAQPSAEEEWLWVQMSVGDFNMSQLKPPSMMEGITIPGYESNPGDEPQGTEDSEEDGAKELETHLPTISIPSLSNKVKLKNIQKKPLQRRKA